MLEFKDLLKEFGEGRTKLVIRFDPKDAFTKSNIFKTHRDYIEYLFKTEHGMDIIQYEHHYDHELAEPKVKECGLIFSLTDSAIQPMVEVWGIVGVNIRASEA